MAETVRVLVTGGRTYRDVTRMANVLDRYTITELAHGAATGADRLAGLYAQAHDIPVRTYPAYWDGPCTNQCAPGHRKQRKGSRKTYCPAAGVYRNDDMLWEFKPDLVIAFPGGTGTSDMVRRAIAALGADRVVLA